jgi:predicted aminopeptidase
MQIVKESSDRRLGCGSCRGIAIGFLRPIKRPASIALPVTVLAFVLSACQTMNYYGQAIAGQWEIQRKSRPIQAVISDPATDADLRAKLETVLQIRRFASEHLALPGHESYGKYADLGRRHVVWNLFAAPEFSLEAKSWRYPIVGSLDYRGYFDESAARHAAADLRQQGYEVMVSGVDAYSTLGWFHDPVLNTFVGYPEVALAELIFHELTHRKLFRRGDTIFNENLANAVAEEGVRRWLSHLGRDEALRSYLALLERRRDFYSEVDRVRSELELLYASGLPEETMRERKSGHLGSLQERLRELRRRWGGRGLESWLQGSLTNAHLVAVTTYHHHIPLFERLIRDADGNMDQFFRLVESVELPDP